ncbi:MFS transporter [Chitinophaga sp. Cy-1792]|uniref:MFS transporter n=1 Tax=Chitinophaga sp. Cy-1792 TaxID=2608339 RepID=UPI0014245D38|nr:MFS transporter [Chitinophaga sp. Cy-1792]NIG55102.1 multidrug effflux MFS transporter [Chitinophaga sp. Cy-1792]
MRQLKKENRKISTVLAFALVPLSGFAMDVYIPSFPQMARDLGASVLDIKLTLTIYLISYGISQLFVGSILDSFGRYKINLISLVIFVVSSLSIVATKNIGLIFLFRFIQGIAISFIVVSKRAFLVDVYTGEKRKHYTSMLTIIWAIGPIVAPFLGGYLQSGFGWSANFYFLACYGIALLLLELRFSGETIKTKHPFHLKSIAGVYEKLLSTKSFSLGILVLGLSYSMVMVFAMSIPFIIEQHFHLTPVVSGYCALASGLSLFMGGLLSKYLIDKPFFKKVQIANTTQLIIAGTMLVTAGVFHALLPIIVFVMLIHFCHGFTYNIFFTSAITSFPEYAATASGLASGGSYLTFSVASYAIVNSINITDQQTLSYSYLILLALIAVVIIMIKKFADKTVVKQALIA